MIFEINEIMSKLMVIIKQGEEEFGSYPYAVYFEYDKDIFKYIVTVAKTGYQPINIEYKIFDIRDIEELYYILFYKVKYFESVNALYDKYNIQLNFKTTEYVWD